MRLTGDTLSTLREVRLEPLEPRQLLAFGQLDQTFGAGGRANVFVGTNADAPSLDDIEIAPGNAIVAGGSGGLVRLTPDGDLDANFGFEGVVPLPGTVYHD